MQKILTAMGNLYLNKKLSEIKEFIVYENDIIYKEGIIEVLKKNNNFDVLIIYEKLPGEIKIRELIKNIKIINSKIKIIYVLENKNEELEKILCDENINDIFYNNEINFIEFIEKIKKLEFSEEEYLKNKIEELKEVITNKNKEIQKYKNNVVIKNKENINKHKYFKFKESIKDSKNKNKIILIISKNKDNLFLKNLIYFLKNKKITIINLKSYTEIKKLKNNIYNKIKIINVNSYLKKQDYKKNNNEKFIKDLLKKLYEQNDYIFIILNNTLRNRKYFFTYAEVILLIIDNNIEQLKKLENIVNSINSKIDINEKNLKILFDFNCKNPISRKVLKNIFLNYKDINCFKIKKNYNIFEKNYLKNKYIKIIQ